MSATAKIVELRDPQPAVEPTVEPTGETVGEPLAVIEGHIDAVQDGRVYGWAWDRAHPGDRLEVELRLERDGGAPLVLAQVVADRPRADLAAGSIGDGGHAFETDRPLPPDIDPARVVAVVRSPTTGETVTFAQPNPEDQRFERLLTPHLQRLGERIDGLRRDQRQLAATQQSIGRLLRELGEGVAAGRTETTRVDGALAERHDTLAESLRDLTERVSGLEVFLVRMDQTLRGFDSAIGKQATTSGWSPFLPLLSGAAGAFLATLVGLALLR